MDRYTLKELTNDDIPWLMEMEVNHGGGIFLEPLTEKEWEQRIRTYEYTYGMWDNEKECFFGYTINCRIENNIWVRQIMVQPEYRKTSHENWGGEFKRPIPYLLLKAAEMGGYCMIGIKEDNTSARGAAEGRLGFDEVAYLNNFYQDGFDMVLVQKKLK